MMTPTAPPNIPPNGLSARQKYAWDWFSYHAAQRMTALNYFVVTVGAFALAYSKCVEHGWRGLGFLIGFMGSLASIAFWFLDVRNEELVNCGREALECVEKELGLSVRHDDYNRKFLVDSTGWISAWVLKELQKRLPRDNSIVESCIARHPFWAGDVFGHRFWIRTIQFFAFSSFLGCAVFALAGYPHWSFLWS